jgi:hypothetical protein
MWRVLSQAWYQRVPRGSLPVERSTVALVLIRNTGMLLVAIWLILSGLAGIVGLALSAPILAALALLAGVFILVGR